MYFVFVDETGDPGAATTKGASAYFGLSLLCVQDKDYEAIRLLLSQVCWLCGTARTIELTNPSIRALNLLRGLNKLGETGVITSSGLYIDKLRYGGRFLQWSDIDLPQDEWAYYLRNYLLRHLLEFHFNSFDVANQVLDLILDRVILTESQRKNTFEYLNSRTALPLKEKFKIPSITHLTIADSQYVGGLELAHLLADILREIAKDTISPPVRMLTDFIKMAHFNGHVR